MRTTMNISLTEPLKKWIEKQVAQRGFSTASEYVRDVLRREQVAELRGQVDGLLIAALSSGPSIGYDATAIADETQSNAAKHRPT
jgi:antitoxin ParD1/3/4